GGDVHGRRRGPQVEGHRVVACVPLDVEVHARRPDQVVAVEVGGEGVVPTPELGVEGETTREVAARRRPRVVDGVVPVPGFDDDTLNAEGGGVRVAIAGDGDASGAVIDDGHGVVPGVADDAERVPGLCDDAAWTPTAFQFFEAQYDTPAYRATIPSGTMREHGISSKKRT